MHMRTLACLSLLLLSPPTFAGIPEPGLTLYGVVRQNLGGAHARLTSGTIQLTITPTVGTPLVLQTTLTNLNSQFSFALEVPFESSVAGFPASTNALELTVAPSTFTRNPVKVNNVNATILAPSTTAMSFGQANRGTFDRMDVAVTLPINDVDGDGLPNEWENQYFFNFTNGVPGVDSDGDGFSNLKEYLAGTDPNNPTSVLWMSIAKAPSGVLVSWQGAPNRIYTLQRSASITFSSPVNVATGVASAFPSANAVTDATGTPRFFYRAVVE